MRGLGVVDFYKLKSSLTYQNLLFVGSPINPILGFIIGTYKKVGFSRSRLFAFSVLGFQAFECRSWGFSIKGPGRAFWLKPKL